MNIKKRHILLILSIALLCTNCTKDSQPQKKYINMTDCVDKVSNLDWSKLEYDKLYIIRSIDEYTQYMKESMPAFDIDFKKQSLLIIKGQANRGVNDIIKKMTETDAENYILNIDLTLNDTLIAEEWHIGILTPTIPYNKEVELRIKYQN